MTKQESIIWDGSNEQEVNEFLGEDGGYRIYDAQSNQGGMFPTNYFKIKTPNGKVEIPIGTRIIKKKGLLYVKRDCRT